MNAIIIAMFMLLGITLAFSWGYWRGYEENIDSFGWGQGWDDGYKFGREVERLRILGEEVDEEEELSSDEIDMQ